MAYASQTATDAVLVKTQGFFERLVKAWSDHQEYMRTVNELNALSSRDLDDLGISSLSIRGIAYDAVYGKK